MDISVHDLVNGQKVFMQDTLWIKDMAAKMFNPDMGDLEPIHKLDLHNKFGYILGQPDPSYKINPEDSYPMGIRAEDCYFVIIPELNKVSVVNKDYIVDCKRPDGSFGGLKRSRLPEPTPPQVLIRNHELDEIEYETMRSAVEPVIERFRKTLGDEAVDVVVNFIRDMGADYLFMQKK